MGVEVAGPKAPVNLFRLLLFDTVDDFSESRLGRRRWYAPHRDSVYISQDQGELLGFLVWGASQGQGRCPDLLGGAGRGCCLRAHPGARVPGGVNESHYQSYGEAP